MVNIGQTALDLARLLAGSIGVVILPGAKVDTKEAWLLSTVKAPIVPGSVTEETSPWNTISCAEIILSVMVLMFC